MKDHQYISLFCGFCGNTIHVPVYCGNRFCPECSKSRTRIVRNRLSNIIRQLQVSKHDSIKLLTLTIPRITSLTAGVELLVKSFRRLRQRKYFRNKVRGGAYFIEFKRTSAGWNPHLHIILESAFIPVEKLAAVWADVSPGTIVDIRRIPPGAAINYVTKYCTKLDLPEALQLQATEALRNKRLFTIFGTWSKVSPDKSSEKAKCEDCGAGCWCFNPYSSISAWLAKKLYVHVELNFKKTVVECEKQTHLVF